MVKRRRRDPVLAELQRLGNYDAKLAQIIPRVFGQTHLRAIRARMLLRRMIDQVSRTGEYDYAIGQEFRGLWNDVVVAIDTEARERRRTAIVAKQSEGARSMQQRRQEEFLYLRDAFVLVIADDERRIEPWGYRERTGSYFHLSASTVESIQKKHKVFR